MSEYFIGQILPEFIGRKDALQMVMTDNSSFLVIALSELTNDELHAFFNTTLHYSA